MGVCRSRHRVMLPEESEDETDEEQLERWREVTRLARRLAFKRRQFAYLGHHLRDIRARGRLLPAVGRQRSDYSSTK